MDILTRAEACDRIRAPRALEHGHGGAGQDTQLLVEINRALAQLAETGELRKIYADPPCHFVPHSRRRPRKRHLPIPGSAFVIGGSWSSAWTPPIYPTRLRKVSARALTSSWREPWPGSLVSSYGSTGSTFSTRPRSESSSSDECDLVLGEAVAANAVADDEELAGKILYSRPYYGTGYVLVQRKDGAPVHSLAELKGAKSQRLGTEAGSVADYSLRQRGYLRRLFRNQLATLKALNDGDIDYAYLWANVGWTLHVSPDFKLKLVPDYVPEDHWNIAVAMRRGDDELKRHIDLALDALIKDGTVVPHHGGLPRALFCSVSGTTGDAGVMPRR